MTDFRFELRESLGLPTDDLTELNRLLTEGIITEGFSDIARKALSKSGEVIKQLQANATVAASNAFQKLNTPVGKIALVFAVGAMGNIAMGAEDFVNNLSQMDGFDSALDSIQDIDQQTDVFDGQSVDVLGDAGGGDAGGDGGADAGGDGGGGADAGSDDDGSGSNDAGSNNSDITPKQKIINMLRGAAKGSSNMQNVEAHLNRALENILKAPDAESVDTYAVGSVKYLKGQFDSGEALNAALKYLRIAADIKLKSF